MLNTISPFLVFDYLQSNRTGKEPADVRALRARSPFMEGGLALPDFLVRRCYRRVREGLAPICRGSTMGKKRGDRNPTSLACPIGWEGGRKSRALNRFSWVDVSRPAEKQ